jgi:glutathione S-transferase
MNIKKVRWRVQRELDSVLQSDHVLEVKKEPVLPMRHEDRTEWLLWCCFVSTCSMQEANHRYLHNLGMMEKMAQNIKDRQKTRAAENRKKGNKRKRKN